MKGLSLSSKFQLTWYNAHLSVSSYPPLPPQQNEGLHTKYLQMSPCQLRGMMLKFLKSVYVISFIVDEA